MNLLKNFQMNMGVLAFFVILSFISVGFAIGQENFWLAGFFFLLGFIIMSFGLRLKRKLNA
ncbi:MULTISPECIES: DUF5325 family protein [Halobacillus]|uniref:Uncharacterized protein n=1 Tax=Halobacillus halophilus (strain ATCC 35676 / DSM 2266 / JCM 20832 / KCTC 3685 / LMG 17431 / NBRC 102448 / NCIMB 2269) TaxID=866895 RepID=I0JM02_HALH3|nr:hypothetical protein CEH05_09090 [Halobacillus halophilus]CCG45172.1 hypothetical protein HBHAL_2824 [Halobacillus halophilus DSM 2266]